MSTTATPAGTDAPAFPIDLGSYREIELDPTQRTLTDQQREDIQHNIHLFRDAIVLFTAFAGARGLSGHSGGPYDTVPEVVLLRAIIKSGESTGKHKVHPVMWDEAGHRVATQYILSVLDGAMPAEKLLHYREYDQKLPGHPERFLTPGVPFSGGRLGHIWPFVNGVAMAHPDHAVIVLGSDGAQQEGDDAEAARLAVAQKLNIKLLIDDNDVTIAGHPSDYMPGFDVAQTLSGHGLPVDTGDGEDIDSLYGRICDAVTGDGPMALINKRPMAPGVPGVEGTTHGHDVFKVDAAKAYFEQRGQADLNSFFDHADAEAFSLPKKPKYAGSSDEVAANRALFGEALNSALGELSDDERKRTVRVFDCDLEGSTGLAAVHKAHPDIFIAGGIMERGNYSAAAGFGYDEDKQGVFATFSAFLEMCVSEITMARMNSANVLAHFSHAGVDDMADNSCHFGINNLFCDGGLDTLHGEDTTRAYFPGDPNQFQACVKRVFRDKGLRFVFSNRSKIPYILKEDGSKFYDSSDASAFEPGRDDVIREGSAGYIVSFGSTLHRALGAVEQLREAGTDVGLICKSTLNVFGDADMQRLVDAPAVLVAEEFNVKTGLGVRLAAELLRRGFNGRYNNIGVHTEGSGGLWRQMGYQGLDPEGIRGAFEKLS